MLSLTPLSFVLYLSNLLFFAENAHAISFPFTVRHPSNQEQRRSLGRLGRRANTTATTGIVPVTNIGNAQYITNITLAGQTLRVIIDTGSSDLWVNFPGTAPQTTDLGKSVTLNYAIGAASGDINTAQLQFDDYTLENQAFLLVKDASSFNSDIHAQGYDGLLGLGPNSGSQIYDKDSSAGQTVINNIFTANKSSDNFISFLLNRDNDPTVQFTGQLTVSEIVPGFEAIENMPKMDVETVHKLVDEDQHWQALTDKDKGIIGPDGNPIQVSSIVPKAPDGQLVAVFDSGFTFNQVPRSVSDAIYGRVQGAVYNTTNQYWTVPCGQELNITLNIGGNSYPVHPLDTVDSSFAITNATGQPVCIGTFQPITSAFSLLGNYDMILGMSFLRNTYTLLDYGNWIDGGEDTSDPYIQLLSVTNFTQAHQDFVKERLNGVDITGSPQYQLLPASQEQHSPVSEAEKKAELEEKILSHWPEILVGCLVIFLLLLGCIIWRCCCRRGRKQPKIARSLSKKFGMGNRASSGGEEFKHGDEGAYVPLQTAGSQANLSLSHNYGGMRSPDIRESNYSGYGASQYGGGGYGQR